MEAEEFRRDCKIDPNELDIEALQQAELFFKWSEQAIEARAEQDRAKLQLDTTEARLDIQCRQKPEEFGIARVTEASIQAAVKTHEDYTNAYGRYLSARETSSLLDSAVQALEQKKRMLEILVTLHGQQYFAGPSVPHNLTEEWQKHQEEVENVTGKRQVQRARKRGDSG